MRHGALTVLTVAFVFASGGLLALQPAAAQMSGSLSGQLCYTDDSYPRPMPAESPPPGGSTKPSRPDGDGCHGPTVPRARVTLALDSLPSVPVRETTTDESGQFAAKDLADGTYRLVATSGGMQQLTATVSVQGATRWTGSMTPRELDQPGLVADEDGNPVAGAEVVSWVCCDGTARTATTDEDGAFALRVPGGWRSLEVRKPGHQAGSVYAFFDGTPLKVELPTLPPPTAYIRGTVTDGTGAPVEGARVSTWGGCCWAHEGGDDGRAMYVSGEIFDVTDASGAYELGVYGGYSHVTVTKQGHITRSFVVESQDKDVTRDVKLPRIPDKTARIEGRIVDAETGRGVQHVSLGLNHPEWGLHSCSSSGDQPRPEPMPAAESRDAMVAPYHPPGCDITMGADGRFSGTVVPGYAILSLWHDAYRACGYEHKPGGCGPEYLPYIRTLSLRADGTTELTIELVRRATPDDVVSGYVLGEGGKPIAGARLQFYNQEAAGWGEAVTDQHGSYKIALRSGYHTVSASAEGHLRWEGTLSVRDGETALDIELVPGEDAFGGCCYAYADKAVAASADESRSSNAGMSGGVAAPATAPSPMVPEQSRSAGQTESQYQDLGGGLGPYDAAKRQHALAANAADADADKGAPALPLLGALAALGAALVLARRKA